MLAQRPDLCRPQAGVTPADFELAMKSGTVDQCLHSFVPNVGDCLFIPAGTVHAVGGGVVMAEVQQTSDCTFRLFDWNRVGPDGKPRKLHIKEAMDSINFDYGPRAPQTPMTMPNLPRGVIGQQLVDCPYFNLYRFELTVDSRIRSRINFRFGSWRTILSRSSARKSYEPIAKVRPFWCLPTPPILFIGNRQLIASLQASRGYHRLDLDLTR